MTATSSRPVQVTVKPGLDCLPVRIFTPAIGGVSLSRYGDGELRICTGGTAVSQRITPPKLVAELREILATETPGLLVCIPNYKEGPRVANWAKYAEPKYLSLYGKQVYGSAFITRPDNAPRIAVPGYWARLRKLWQDKDVILVTGVATASKSLCPEIMTDAASIRRV